jgi:NADPH2:quinone reductase
MRAIGFKSNGGPEVLTEIQVPAAEPGEGQVLIEVAYAGVNFAEVQHRRGEFGRPDGPGGYDVPGLEVSGTVTAVGAGVVGVREGQRVAAYLPAFGGYGEFAVAPADLVRPVAAGLSLAVAASVPCVFPAAYGVLDDAGRLRPGESVLIHPAAGGVGSVAARIARFLGAGAIFGTVGSPSKLGRAADLGYDALFLRDGFAAKVTAATGGRGVGLVLDPVGGSVRDASLGVLAPFGRLVAYGDLARSGNWAADVWDLWKGNKTIAGYNIGDLARRDPEIIGDYLARALDALAGGQLPAEPPTVLPLAQAARAHRRLEGGSTLGKTVLRVSDRLE